MTQDHPITPPPELVNKIFGDALRGNSGQHDYELRLIHAAYAAGADQELGACCHEVQNMYSGGSRLRAARRPKPPSLKEQALETLRSMQIDPVVINGVNLNAEVMAKYDTIRRALEQLPN